MEAAIEEFSLHTFDLVKVSTIIKNAKIPRGSFYQYFEDKYDLYRYVFDKIAEKKMEYLGDLLPNNEELSFLDLFYELYCRGAQFAYDNPKYVKITTNLMRGDQEIYQRLVGNNLQVARDFYMNYIDQDKARGRINPDIDSKILADLVVDMTKNVAIEELTDEDDYGLEKMKEKVRSIIYIFKKGIHKGE